VHEGGISTPLIAHWPAGIDRRGELVHEPGHLIDVMATCVDVSGAKYPTERNDQPIKPMEGLSLVPAFAGNELDRDAIYWEHEGNRAIRQGDWKLVAKGVKGKWELYNLADDRTELDNLAEQMPERVEQLTAKWQAYAERANVLPLNPNRAKAKEEAKATKEKEKKAKPKAEE
jgi:arylsulfatase